MFYDIVMYFCCFKSYPVKLIWFILISVQHGRIRYSVWIAVFIVEVKKPANEVETLCTSISEYAMYIDSEWGRYVMHRSWDLLAKPVCPRVSLQGEDRGLDWDWKTQRKIDRRLKDILLCKYEIKPTYKWNHLGSYLRQTFTKISRSSYKKSLYGIKV